MITLRDYQEKILEEAMNVKRAVIWLPTGGGKTEIICALASRVKTRVLFVADRIVLVEQTKKRFEKYGIYPDVIQANNTLIRGRSNVTVASAQTLARANGKKVLSFYEDNDFSHIVIDEAHILHREHKKLIERYKHATILGLSATPLRKGMKVLYERIIKGPSYADMIKNGHLVKPCYYAPIHDREKLKNDLSGVRVSHDKGDYVTSDLSRVMGAKYLIGEVVDEWLRITKGEMQTIVFCVDIAHARRISEEFHMKGVPVESIDHYTKAEERESMFARFRNGEVKVLTSVNVLSIGFDEPCAQCAILARPTKSKMLYIQQVGRVLRPFDGKEKSLVLDHALNVEEHGFIEEFRPEELSFEEDSEGKRSKKKKEKPQVIVCKECSMANAVGTTICGGCGAILYRKKGKKVIYLPGVLVNREEEENAAETYLIKQYYLQALHVARTVGYKDGWAYYKTLQKFGESTNIPHSWRKEKTEEPTFSDLKRIYRYKFLEEKWQKERKKS